MANAHFIREFYCVYAKTVAPKNYIMGKNMSHLYYFYHLFLIPITAGFVILIHNSSGINTGMLCCIVKLPDKVFVSYTDNKTVLQLKQFAEVLLTGLTFKNW